MKVRSLLPSIVVKIIHVIVILSMALTSAFSAASAKRAVAKALDAQGSGLTPSGLFSQIVPAYHRQQAQKEKVERFLGIDEGKASMQASGTGPSDGGRDKPTPTSSSNLPPTAMPTATDTQAPVPTEIITPTETLAPSLTPPPCRDGSCDTPTPFPTPTETPTATPVITGTAPITGEIDGRVAITLTLTATPTLPAPGDVITLTWESKRDKPLDGLELRLTLPEGIDLWGVPDGSYDPTTRQLRMPILMASGSLGFVILPGAEGSYTFDGELWWKGELRVKRSLSLPRRGAFKLDPRGGRAWGFNRRVDVNFPEGALPEAVDVEVKPPVKEGNPPSLSGNPFEIVAISQATGEEVNQFTRPITIEVSYDEAQFGNEESGLQLFYYDETSRDWYPLPTRVDTDHNRLTAWSDHLTLFDYQDENWEAARLPNLEAFQVSSFTGASSYSMQIQVPPGPAGLQPSLSLSYNSQTVDSASSRTQASWVGMGWNLGENYIQRNQNGTPNFYGKEYNFLEVKDNDYDASLCHPGSTNTWCGSDGDDTFSLVVDGQSWTLIRAPDNDGNIDTIEYRTTAESYWRVIRYHSHGSWGGYPSDTSYWYVWDKTGVRFTFSPMGMYPAYPTSRCSDIFIQTWQWSLTKTTNVFGQELTYTYAPEYSDPDKPKYANGCTGNRSTTTLAVYPAEIFYPNNRYKVSFIRSTTPRTDWKTNWQAPAATVLYKRSLLERVEVWENPDGDTYWGSYDERLIRRYVLGFADNDHTIFPSVVWEEGGKTPTLISITEYGFGGTSSLPATTFTYGDNMHLTVGANGYGGESIFAYESIPWYELDGDAMECDSGGNVNGEIFMDTKTVCDLLDTFKSWFGPMQIYKVYVEVKKFDRDSASTARLGMYDGVSTQYGNDLVLTNSYQPLEYYFPLSVNATGARSKLSCTGNGCYFRYFKVIPVTTRYRVVSRTAYDSNAEYGANIAETYRYDEPATNDAAHSALVAGTQYYERYTPAYGEYRGNGMVKETDPSGKVSTTFYYQDDNRSGDASVSLVGTENVAEAFQSLIWTDYASQWSSGAPSPGFERILGDIAAKVEDTAGTWNSSIYRTAYSVENNEAVMVQFRLSATTQQTIIAVNSISPDNRRWGIKQVNNTLYLHDCIGTPTTCDTSTPTTVLLQNVIPNAWYVLLLIVDDDGDDVNNLTDNHFLVQVWQRDEPSLVGRYEAEMASEWSTRDWRFMAKVNTGVVWLDEYSEGKLYSLSSTYYATQSFTTADEQLPTKENGVVYRDVQRAWTYVTEQRSASFEGDAAWNGTRATNEYNTSEQGGAQYGNLTRVVEASWDAANSRWQDYRLTRTLFYPYTGTTSDPLNLVGLLAIAKSYSCNSTDYNGACSTNYVEGQLTGAQWSLYDTHTSFDVAPTEGKLTGQRALLRCYGTCSTGTEYFSDSSFGYDQFGNRTTTTVYTGEGAYSSFGQGTARSSYTCYGGGDPVGGYTCAEDYYHTYALWERNALGHNTQMIYDAVADPVSGAKGYTLSVPVSLIDPNNVTTSAEYDGFGRMTAIIRDGDTSANPTARMSYHDTASPFYTQAEQRLSGSTYFTIRKYYNGLGQLLQTQVVGAVVNGVTNQDILVYKWYTNSGQVEKQSVPYEVSGGSGYHARNSYYAYNAHTTYDGLGRTEYVYGTTVGISTHYVYKDLETEVTDANGNTTHTLTDVWGRITWVIPPTGASVNYSSYDTQGRLKQVVYGNATTDLTYDIAGRKLTMSDPDLGNWSYTYDALSNLSTQTDARICTITMSYDALNRLTGKSYSGCAATTAPTYTYDSTAGGNKGIGRRTGMTDGSGSASWIYDARGRTTQESKVISGSGTFKTQWTYNSADLPVTMIYPGNNSGGAGETVTFTYHPQMLLNTAVGANTYVKGVTYDAAGRTDLLSLGNSGGNTRINVDYEYNDWDTQSGRLNYLKAGTPGTPTSLQNLAYTYDNNGNILTIVDAYNSSQKQCFVYDGLNRLTSARAGDSSCNGLVGNGEYADETYTYNATTGNLESKTGMGSYHYSSTHKHAVDSTSANGYSYSYDANGNMNSRNLGGHYYYYAYDAENRLTSVSGETTASFVYDGDGVRVKGTAGGVTTAYVGNHFEWTGSASTMKKYYYASSTRVAVRTGTADPLWLLGDHLGSTSQTANFDGTVYTNGWQLYKPWGEKRYPSGASVLPTTIRYTGQRADSYINLYWYGSRWYDDSLGRFIQPDSIVPEASQGTQAWDRFSYANNNPVRYNDPSGHCIGPLLVICIAAADILVQAAPVIIAAAATAMALTSDSHYHEETPEEREAVVTWFLAIAATVSTAGAAAAPYTTSTGYEDPLLTGYPSKEVGNIAHSSLESQYLETIPSSL